MFSGRLSEAVFTTPVRLTLGFLSLYILGSLIIFGYLNYQLSELATGQIDKALQDQERLLLLQQHDYGFSGVYRAIQNELTSKGKEERAYRVVDGAGNVVLEDGDLPLPRDLAAHGGIRQFTVHPSDGGASYEARLISFVLPDKMSVFIAMNTERVQRLKQGFWYAFLKTEILIVLLGLVLGLWLTQWFHNRIEAFNQLAKRIVKSGDLSSRMPATGNDEFAVLANNVNAMLERIERLVQGIRQVSDNIAHDLRSPLTRLRADVEVALQREDPAGHRQVLERVLSELEGMQTVFSSLLSLGQAEAGGMRLKKETLDLSAFLSDVVELYSPSAEDNEITLGSDIESGLGVQGDRQLLAQTFSNLLDNALKYVPSGGKVLLRAGRKGNKVEIVVEDNGPGIPPDMREKVFERFTRVDPSRTLPGTGLGLALVKAFVELHDGSVYAAESTLGGAAFIILLPEAKPAPVAHTSPIPLESAS